MWRSEQGLQCLDTHYCLQEKENAFFLAFILINSLAAWGVFFFLVIGDWDYWKPLKQPPFIHKRFGIWGHCLIVVGECYQPITSTTLAALPAILSFTSTGFLSAVAWMWFKIPFSRKITKLLSGQRKEPFHLEQHRHTKFPWWLSDKEPACQCRRRTFNPWVVRSPRGGHGSPLQCSRLRNPTDRGAWRAVVHWAAKEADVTYRLNNNQACSQVQTSQVSTRSTLCVRVVCMHLPDLQSRK